PLALRGLRSPGAGGDGLRDSRRHLPWNRHGGGRGRSGRARRPARSELDRTRYRGSGGAARGARRARSRAGPRVHVEPRGRRDRGALARARMKLVVVDADVLGRRRTGDETYVRNLLTELPPLAAEAGLRIAAATRRPDLVPEGAETLELPARFQELRMAIALPRLLRDCGASLCHTQYALPPRA